MFEDARLIPRPLSGSETDDRLVVGSHDESFAATRGSALRALDWGELTAKLEAARDLRQVLRSDTRFNIQGAAASFGDAAASFFQTIEEGKPDVNLAALEATKASDAKIRQPSEDAEIGEVRDDR